MKRIALALSLVLAGCTSMDSVMKSWLWQHKNDLMASWGPPQQIIDMDTGGQILIYSSSRSWVSPGYSTTNSYGRVDAQATSYGANAYGSAQGSGRSFTYNVPPQTHTSTSVRTFWTGMDGLIYRTHWRG